MKRLLMIFLFGQLLLLSFTYNQAIYQIFELNHVGDTTLTAYEPNRISGDTLSRLYDALEQSCLRQKQCRIQFIKHPVSTNTKIHMVSVVYHSDWQAIEHTPAVSPSKRFYYRPLTKAEFVDSNGRFYTNMATANLKKIERALQLRFTPFTKQIDYRQYILFNAVNFTLLLVISQLVLFIYTFSRIKVNAVKKLLGFTPFKMVYDSMRTFLIIEVGAFSFTLLLHFLYYLHANLLVPRYFIGLICFMGGIIVINLALLLVTQLSIKYINIAAMLKNKTFSQRMNITLYALKVSLILAITCSSSLSLQQYKQYAQASKELQSYRTLDHYYLSNGFSSQQYERAERDASLLKQYGQRVKQLYEQTSRSSQLLVHGVSNTSNSLARSTIKDHDFRGNYIVANERYLRQFATMPSFQWSTVDWTKPIILVPSIYRPLENSIRDYYLQQYNNRLIYNSFYDVPSENRKLKTIQLVYIPNDARYNLLGRDVTERGAITLHNPIIIVDHGQFDSLYYYDELNKGNLIFDLPDRDAFAKLLKQYKLQQLVIAGTLVTKHLNKLNYNAVLLTMSLTFTTLFLLTLLFFIYMSNYVELVANRKKYVVRYVQGHHVFALFRSHLWLTLLLLSALIFSFFTTFNPWLYVAILAIDLLVLFVLYKRIIQRNLSDVLKGG